MTMIGKKRTVVFYLIVLLSFFLLLQIAVSAYLNYTSRTSIREQVGRANSEVLAFYMESIDTALNNAGMYFYNYLDRDQSVLDLKLSEDETARQFAKVDIYAQMGRSVLLHERLDAFFFYLPSEKEDVFIVAYSANAFYIMSIEQIKRQLNTLLSSGHADLHRWFPMRVDERNFLFRIVEHRGAYMGGWSSVETATHPLGQVDDLRESITLLVDADGTVLNQEGYGFSQLTLNALPQIVESEVKYEQISQDSTVGAFSLVSLVPDAYMAGELYAVQQTMMILTLFAVVMLISSAVILETLTYRPLAKLRKAMNSIRQGNMNARADESTSLREFYEVNSTFNSMMDEIRGLKINIYEQKLKQSESHLQYLQMQIHPHFFQNCLNLIYSLARLENYAQIQELVMHMVSYLRYRYKNPASFVSLKEETEHIKSYMQIQEMRFPGKIYYSAIIEPELMSVLIPPLVIQSFVENASKYAIGFHETTEIAVEVKKENGKLHIRIQDNGGGFSTQLLMHLNIEETDVPDDEGSMIGIRNVRQRLNLVYPNDCQIYFYNANGAVVEMTLPIREEA